MYTAGRRSFLTALVPALAFLFSSSRVSAEDVAVPVPLQAALLAKVAAYDRNLPERAGERVLVLILVRAETSDSLRAAAQMESALSATATIAGKSHVEERLVYTTPADLAASCRAKKPAIVYVTPGFGSEGPRLSAALQGVDVLTVAAVSSYVSQGTVLAFDVQSGYPKILVHLARALAQHVSFEPAFLRLAKVVDR
jgi:hypothetical protein